jgi:pyruvate/2-oxoacid:ferredoxin oxidoreductase alpha subunit
MPKQLIKGNEAIVKSAILAGCRAFYGYPITPASEIAEAAAKYMPLAGGTFLQAESETASIYMLFGAAAAGVRAMSASSGPGISLMQEGLSYLAGAELPCVVADIMRAGPGLGNIAPEQGDYHQVVKGGGHGCYHTIVLAPDSVQEMADLTALAFDLADEYRNPVFVLADGAIGQMMEPVEFMARPVEPRHVSWAVEATPETRQNLISSIYLEPDNMEAHIRKLEAKYRRCERQEVRFEEYRTGDAEIVLMGYGITARILKAVVEQLRALGLRVGLLRPITLYPFPVEAVQRVALSAKLFGVVELSNGQMLDDVRLALNGARPVEFYGRFGGNVPSAEEVARFVRNIAGQYGVAEPPAEPQKQDKPQDQAEPQEEVISHV